MIIGIGSDITSIPRIVKLLKKNKSAFLKKIFTDEEIIAINSLNEIKIAGYIANRFAAKEALAKALGTGIGKHLSFQDISIAKNDKGKPYFICGEKFKAYLQKNYGNEVNIHLTMSNEEEHAQAFVVIEKL